MPCCMSMIHDFCILDIFRSCLLHVYLKMHSWNIYIIYMYNIDPIRSISHRNEYSEEKTKQNCGIKEKTVSLASRVMKHRSYWHLLIWHCFNMNVNLYPYINAPSLVDSVLLPGANAAKKCMLHNVTMLFYPIPIESIELTHQGHATSFLAQVWTFRFLLKNSPL